MLQRMARTVLTFAILGCAAAFAGSYTVYNTDSGWYDESGYHISSNTNYYAGNSFGVQLNDFFTFDLTGVSGAVTAANFNVNSYLISASGTYSIYATSLSPSSVIGDCSGCVSIFDDLTWGPLVGSIDLGPGNSYSTLQIAFNAAGLAWLTANEGASIVLGGAYPQPGDGGDNFVFGISGFDGSNNLAINPGSVPEPATCALLGLGLLGIAGWARRRQKV